MARDSLIQRQWGRDDLDAMAASVEASPYPALRTVQACLAGAHLWEFSSGDQRALLAVRGQSYEHGRQLDILGAVSLGDRIDSAQLTDAMDRMAAQYRHVDALCMATRHAHLVRACERAGWTATGTIVTKNLRLQ